VGTIFTFRSDILVVLQLKGEGGVLLRALCCCFVTLSAVVVDAGGLPLSPCGVMVAA
jgi:hypothetical protein